MVAFEYAFIPLRCLFIGFQGEKPMKGIVLMMIPVLFLSCNSTSPDKSRYLYRVHRLKEKIVIDSRWDKPQWKKVPSISIENIMGEKPEFLPNARVKLLYDDENLYVIFRVEDRYVRAVVKEFHGRVWEDACVEFFFAPNRDAPLKYFNVEMNCGGTALTYFNRIPDIDFTPLAADDMKQIEIAHSMPKIVDPEIPDPVVWTLEYRLPLAVLEKYTALNRPEKGVVWRANFQKCAESNSHPHWMTWAKIDYPEPRFHMPEFFGTIEFAD